MSEDTTVSHESQDSSKTDGDANTDTQATNWDELDYDTAVSRAKELEDKNRQLYARAKKAEEKAKAGQAEEQTPAPKQESTSDDEWKQKLEFVATKGRDLDPEEINEVVAYAKGAGKTYEEALESPVIKTYIETRKREKKVQDATPPPSGSSRKVQGKTWSEFVESADSMRDVQKQMGESFFD